MMKAHENLKKEISGFSDVELIGEELFALETNE